MTVEQARRDELRSVARSGGISLAGAITSAVFGFILVVLVSRGLGPAGAGLFSVAVAIFMTIGVTGRLGADTALVRALPALRQIGRTDQIRHTVTIALVPVCVAMVVVAAVMWWLAPTLAPLLMPGHDGAQLLRIIAATLPLGTASFVALSATRGLGRVVPLVLQENLIKPIARCALVSLALLLGAGVYGVTMAWAVATVVGVFLAAFSLHRMLKPFPSGNRTASWREFWAFAAPRGAAAFFETAGIHAGVVLVNALSGAADAGVFNAAFRLVMAGTLAMQALRIANAPQISRLLTAGEVGQAQHVHQISTIWVVLCSWPVYLVLAVWPAEVLRIFGDDFRSGALPLSILAIATLLNLATGNVATVLLMSGRSGSTLAVTVVSLLTNVALVVILAPAYGVLGAAIAKAVSIVFENLAVEFLVRRGVGVRTFSRPLWIAAGLGALCFAAPALILHITDSFGLNVLSEGAGGLIVGAVVVMAGGVIYAAAVLRFRRQFELAALGSVLPGPLRRIVRRAVGTQESSLHQGSDR